MRRRTVLAGAAGLIAGRAAQAQAPTFPDRPVTIIVPFPPGGATDQVGRPLAVALQHLWKQPVVIQNRGGAGGGIGMMATANSRPDGYTVMLGHPSISSIPAADRLFGRPVTVERGMFEPLALLAADPLILVVKGDAPWQNLDGFLADARKQPGRIPYSSSGAYGPLHLPIEMLAQSAGVQLQHVPFTGGGPAITAVLGGHVAATVGSPAVVAPQIQSGVLKGLVCTGARRVALLPDVPTAMELGHKDVEFYLWVGSFAPLRTPPETVQALRRGIGEVARDPAFLAQMQSIGLPLDYRDGPGFSAFLDADTTRIESAIQRIGRVE
jgi:tripartite-type tricarboxylate transporter receptor subunit TctC